jgi:hypothetical protein
MAIDQLLVFKKLILIRKPIKLLGSLRDEERQERLVILVGAPLAGSYTKTQETIFQFFS